MIGKPTSDEAQEPLSGSVGQLAALTLTIVRSGPERASWNELVERYHYLGYRVPVGANLRYLVHLAGSKFLDTAGARRS